MATDPQRTKAYKMISDHGYATGGFALKHKPRAQQAAAMSKMKAGSGAALAASTAATPTPGLSADGPPTVTQPGAGMAPPALKRGGAVKRSLRVGKKK